MTPEKGVTGTVQWVELDPILEIEVRSENLVFGLAMQNMQQHFTGVCKNNPFYSHQLNAKAYTNLLYLTLRGGRLLQVAKYREGFYSVPIGIVGLMDLIN